MIINKYPYTDAHELNLDWIVNKIQEEEKDIKDMKSEVENFGNELDNFDERLSEVEQGTAILEKDGTNIFNDAVESYMKKLVSSIEFVQTGSGTASPSNPRPIIGYNDCTITISNGYDTNTSTISFGAAGTVYRGEVELTRGILKVTHGLVDLGSQTWIYTSAYNAFSTTISGKAFGKTNYICSEYNTSDASITSLPDLNTTGQNGSSIIYIKDTSQGTDPAAFKTAMSGVQLVYELATPVEYQLTPTQIKTLEGLNVCSSSCGDVTETTYIINKTIAWLLDIMATL